MDLLTEDASSDMNIKDHEGLRMLPMECASLSSHDLSACLFAGCHERRDSGRSSGESMITTIHVDVPSPLLPNVPDAGPVRRVIPVTDENKEFFVEV